MIQIFRFPQSGASTCHGFSGKYHYKTYVGTLGLRNSNILRNQSDSSVFRPVVNKKIVKTKRMPVLNKRLKETELLKVTKTQTTQTTMTIGKLNASHVAAFVEEPGMILKNVKNAKSIKVSGRSDLFSSGTLGKFKKKFPNEINIHSVKDFNSPQMNLPDMLKSSVNKYKQNEINCSVSQNPEEIEKNDVINFKSQTPKIDSLSEIDLSEKNFGTSLRECQYSEMGLASSVADVTQSRKLQENLQLQFSQNQVLEESKKTFISELNPCDQNYSATDSTIHSYIDVCVHCDLLNYAFEFLTNGSKKKVKTPAVYHTLLRRLSEEGDLTRADVVLTKMENSDVPCTPQTFALYLLCVAQCKMENALQKTAIVMEKLHDKGFEINDLFTKTNLKIRERENVLKQIRKIVPYFDIAPSIVNLNSNCQLVADLYKDQHRLTSPAPFINRDFISQTVAEQLSLEDEQICNVEKIGVNRKFSMRHRMMWSALKETWGKRFRTNFESSLRALETEFKIRKSKTCIYPYLRILPTDTFEKLAVEEIDQLVEFSETYSLSTIILYQRLGHKVYQRYCKKKNSADEEFNERMRRQIEIYCRWYANPVGPARNARQKWQMLMGDNPDMTSLYSENITWPNSVEIAVGKFLYNVLFKSTIIPGRIENLSEDTPAFYLILRQKSNKVTEEIKIHQCIKTIIKRANNTVIKFPVDQLPMLCPPKPWSSSESGGYYFLCTDFVRYHFGNTTNNYLKTVPNQNLYAVFDSLNALQSVPWKINEKVLDVAINIFNKGGSKDLDIPVKPDETPLNRIPKNLDFKLKLKAYQERAEIMRRRQDEHGLWCEGLYKLSLANHYRNKVFWLPQNLDFRGRVYPVPPHVSHVSADLYRSLLLFAKKERLGEKGFDWLKIHVVNLTGAHKKKSIQERLEYANQILPDIVDSAENPLNGKGWWTESDDPWQTLAACFEINEVLKCDNPEMFETGFPIHQDGSCNGLQHYAALGRDTFGAISVNLSPAETPQDVYSDVANLIELERAKDEAAGVEIAKLLKGFVSRKVVKRPVMTTVYGVTWFGAKLQIAGVLADMPDFPKSLITPASSYLATKIFESLRKLFTSAKEIQDWFNECSDVITRNCNKTISWENPIGLPVVQPYFKQGKKSKSIKPDWKKQKNAFAPNFIHSLDSTHMMLTAMRCELTGLTFASVHDCFWTHPASVDVMNRICRESFVSLHSLQILKTLSNNFIKDYVNDKNSEACKVFSEIPKLGDFDLKTVIDSVYFFA